MNRSPSLDSRFLNRELSWIEFNFRVMEQAEDATLPPLERLKFAAITATNADEFFMVRVGGLKPLQRAGVAHPDPAGMTPAEQLAAVSERMHELVARQHACLRKDIEPLLRKGGIRRLRLDELNAAQMRHVESQFHNFLFPVLSPVAVSLEDEFPLLAGLGLALHVRLAPAAAGAGPRHALVAVPKNVPRFLALPGESGFAYVLLEEVIRAQVGHLF
ncbi:MAG TPA: RNA degradosome polyphosphate kinase, partial [Kiritimatiellia bacterium]|nr:RNA degradosome polyphosphate kinase [Kiritimatiellia bacterium]